MPRQGKREYVTFKSVRLPLYPHGTGWRYAYPDKAVRGGWRYGRGTTRALAREAAHRKAIEIANGFLDISNLSEDDASLCRQFLSLSPTRSDLDRLREWLLASAVTIAAARSKYESELPEKKTKHLRDVLSFTQKLADFLPPETQLAHVEKIHLTEFLNTFPVGAKRKITIRSYLVLFWNWAKLNGIVSAPNGITVADTLPRPKQPKKKAVRYLSPQEMRFILQTVGEEFLPRIVICGFAGVRAEELKARETEAKPPMDWSQVKRDRRIIEITAETSKVGRRRLVPITDTLAAWLDHIAPPASGTILTKPPSHSETARLGKLLEQEFRREEGWPHNCLRHSILTYLAAQREDLPAIAIEAGTSVERLRENYVEATDENEAGDYFALTPSDTYRTSR